ncbi:hypothetical protein F8388_016825, partial [Cannabis sativa]
GEDDPWVKSVNNNVGRQYWEFDHNHNNTPQQIAQLEHHRHQFHLNRFHTKYSSDIPMRLQEDLYYPHPKIQDMLWGFLNKVGEPLLKSWPLSKLTQRALHTVMQHIHHEDEDTNYVCAGPVNKYFNGSQLWDCALAVQAIMATHLEDEYTSMLKKAHYFIKTHNNLIFVLFLIMKIRSENSGGNPSKWYRHISKGGWAFSTPDNSWIVSDCTAEALEDHLKDAVHILLSLQDNNNGGFASYELIRSYSWLEMMNPSEIFENIMIEHKYVECTASVIKGLKSFTEKYKKHKKKEIEECIRKAAEFIESKQEEDGSWYGSWGVCYTYATYFAVKGLIAAGRTYQTSHSIRKASTFLLSKQLPSSW